MAPHNVHTQSQEFVEACTQHLLLDTLYKCSHPSILSDHAIELIQEEFQQGWSGDPISASNAASINTTCRGFRGRLRGIPRTDVRTYARTYGRTFACMYVRTHVKKRYISFCEDTCKKYRSARNACVKNTVFCFGVVHEIWPLFISPYNALFD